MCLSTKDALWHRLFVLNDRQVCVHVALLHVGRELLDVWQVYSVGGLSTFILCTWYLHLSYPIDGISPKLHPHFPNHLVRHLVMHHGKLDLRQFPLSDNHLDPNAI